MRKIIYLIMALLASYPALAGIGCDQAGDYLHCFNSGNVAPDTYYKISSGFLQHANTIGRMADVTYTYGYGRVSGGVPTIFGTNIIPNVLKNATDNTTYYWADSSYTQIQGGDTFTLHKNHTQNLTSDYVQITFTFKSDRRITGDNYFFHGFRNLDVAQDGKADLVTIILENGSLEQYNMSGLNNFSGRLNKIVLDGGPGTYSYVIDFKKNVSFWYNNSHNINGDWLFGEYIGTINADQLYKYSYDWIDASCQITCALGASITVTDGAEFDTIDEYQTKSRTCRWTLFSLGGAKCTISNDCGLAIEENKTISSWFVITSTSNQGLRCGNATSCSKQANLLKSNQPYTFNLSGYIPPPEINNKETQTRCSISGQLPDIDFKVTTYLIYPNITVWTPPNNTRINQTNPSAIFGCNWSGGDPPDTLTLLFNDTLNYTQSANTNLSRNVTFDSYACYIWTCQACEYGHCHYALNGNFTFCQYYLNYSVIQWKPPNSTILNQTINWSVFACNWTGDRPTNISLVFNNTINFSQNPSTNLSRNVTFDTDKCWIWTCQACGFGTCRYTDNGNYTICLSNGTIIIIIPGGQVVLPPKHKDSFTQFSPEDKTILGILGGILFIGIITYLVKRKLDTKGDNIEGYSRELKK